ncbi:MAG TPA: hypothetical protein DIC60_10305 [Lachnospiraceae bacterium]|nr:hypothetical protein [Lachnospiraceae bacterium]
MSSQKRNVIIGVIAIAVCVGIYAVINIPKGNTADKNTDVEGSYISYHPQFKAAQLTIESEGEKNTLVKQGVNWVIQGKENIGLVQLSIDQLIAYAKNLEYTEVLTDNLDSSEEFGLNDGNHISITGDDGTIIDITVGDKTVDGTGYYVVTQGDEHIYLVEAEVGSVLKKSTKDLRDRHPHYVDYDNSTYVKIEKSNGIKYSIEPNPSGALTEGYGEYILTGAYAHPLPIITEELTKNIGEPLYNITAVEFIDEPQDLAVYGLEKPQMIISSADVNKNECVIQIGNQATPTTVYAKFSNKDYVCTVSKDNIDKIDNAKLFDIIDKDFVTEEATDFTEIKVMAKETETAFVIDAVTKEVSLNGKNVPMVDFSEVYKQISALTADGEVMGEYGDEEAVISFTKLDGTTKTLRFLSYDDNYYAVEVDGATEFLTGKKAIELVMYALDSLK